MLPRTAQGRRRGLGRPGVRASVGTSPRRTCSQRLAGTAATLTAWGIRYEQITRRVLGLRDRPPRPDVHCHEGGAGESLVLLSGFGVSGLVWPGPWVRELEQTYRVIRVDNRGTVRSRWTPPFTIADLADDVVAVLDARGIESAVVLGHSMGGLVAQELALRHPERVDRLVLVSTIAPTPTHRPTLDYGNVLRHATIPSLLGGRSRAEVLARFYLGTSSRTFRRRSELRKELVKQLRARPMPLMGVLQQSRAIVAWRHPERLAALATPTTVVAGADDPVVLPANGKLLAELIPGSHYVELPGVGHMVPWEAGETLIDLLEG